MAIRLGDVNFRLGADTSALDAAVSDLKKFGDYVDAQASKIKAAGAAVSQVYANQGEEAGKAAAAAVASGNRVVSSLQKQEKASVDALRQVLEFNKVLRKTEFGQTQIPLANQAWINYNKVLTSGRLTMTDFNRATGEFRNSMSSIGRGLADGTKSMGGFAGLLRRVSQESVLLYGPLGGLAIRFTTLANIAESAGVKVAAFFGGMALAGVAATFLTGKVLNAGKAFQGYEIALTGIYGSQALANQQLQVATKIANDAGVSYAALIPEYMGFAAAIKGTALEGQKADDVFRSVAMVAGQLQLPAEQVQGIFKALEQMMSKGVVQSEELRGQLGDRLPGAFNIAARAMGVSTAELGKMLKAGQVVSSDFLPKFAAELEKTYGTVGLTKVINYTAAQMRMNNAFTDFFRTISSKVDATGKMTKIFDAIASTVQYLTAHLEDLGKIIVIVSSALSGMVFEYAVAGAVAFGAAVTSLASAIWNLNFALELPAMATFISVGTVLATTLYLYHNQITTVISDFHLFMGVLWGVIAVISGAFVVGLAAASGAVWALSDAFIFLRGAMLRTGIAGLIVLLGEAMYWYTTLANAVGSFANANTMLVDVVKESWGHMTAYIAGEIQMWIGHWHNLVGQFSLILHGLAKSLEDNFVNPAIGAFVGTKDAIISVWNNVPKAFAHIGWEIAKSLADALSAGTNHLVDWANSLITLGGTINLDMMIKPFDISKLLPAEPEVAKFGADIGTAYANAMSQSYVTALSTGTTDAAVAQFQKAATAFSAAAADFATAAGPTPALTGLQQILASVNQTASQTAPIIAGQTIPAVDDLTKAGGKAVDKYQELKDTLKSAFEDVGMAIVQDTKNIGDAFKKLAADIITELYKVLVVEKLVGSFGNATTPSSGILGFLGTAFSSGGMFGSVTTAVMPHASGGPFSAGQPMIVGEKGPELITPSFNGTVTKNSAMGSGDTNITQIFQISTGVQQTVRAEIKAMMPQIKAAAVQAVMQAKTRGGKAGALL